MAEVKWIKIVTDIFDDDKILLIESMPDADAIIVIWFKLLCLAGKQNNSGVFLLNGRIPYTEEMFATIFRRPLNTVRLALKTFEEFGMIEIVNNAVTIPNWEKHQKLDALEASREATKNRVARYREKQKLLVDSGNVTSNVTVTQSNAIEEDKEEDIDIYNISKDILCNKNLLPIVEAWNNLNLSKLITIKSNSNRFKLLQARIKEVGIDKVIETINSINNSSFLKGQNNKGWVITFDWLIKPNNFIKVLEGNYLDKGGNEYGNNRVRSFGQNTGKSESQFQVKINTRNHQLTAEDEARAERELI
jgi:predicted phage replisome organizer